MRTIYLLVLIILFAGCNSGGEKSSVSEKAIDSHHPGKVLNVGFLIVDGVYNSELVAPMDIFHHTIFHDKMGMKVFTVAPKMGQILTFEGLKIIPDYSFNSDSLPTIDVLVVPSAEHSMDSDLENEELISFVKDTGLKAKYILSLCDGAFLLAKAGLLDGLECTTFPGDRQKMRDMFPQLSIHDNVSFIHHGKAITSAGGAKSYDPAMYLAHLLYGEKAARGIGEGMVIDWDPSKILYKTFK